MHACVALLVAFFQGTPNVVPAPALDGPVAVTNLTVVAKPGESAEGATILIEDGRIAAMGPSVTLPAGTRVLDGTGLIAYAGFVDGLTRVGVADARNTAEDERRIEDDFEPVAEGPRVAMDPANRNGIFARRSAEDLIDFNDRTYAAHRSAGFTAALVAPPRAILGGRASVLSIGDKPLRRSVLAGDIVHTASFASPGAHALTERGRYPSSAFAVIAHLRQTMWDAAWYDEMQRYAVQHPAAALPRDRDLDAIVALRAASTPLVWEASDKDEILRVLTLAREFGVRPVLAGAGEAYLATEQIRSAGVPVIASLKLPRKVAEYKVDAAALTKEPTDTSLFGKNWEKRAFLPKSAYDEAKRWRDERVRNLASLESAGIRWCIGTHDLSKPGDALDSIAEILEAGLPRDAVLKALTTTPAELFGVARDLGTIEVGKRASFVLFSKPIGEKDAKVRYTFVDGVQFDGDEAGAAPSGGGAESARRGGAGGPTREGRTGRGGDRRGPREAAEPAAESTAPTPEPDDDKKGAPPTSEPASEPTSNPASKPVDPLRSVEPAWVIETPADRDPGIRTGGNVLLRNALVLTVSGDDLPGTDVLVQGGKIAGIGKNLTPPQGVTTIDAGGYVISPGVIDGHSHIALDATNEGTLSITCEVRCADVVNTRGISAYRALAGGVTTIHAMHGSANTIGGENVLLKLKWGRNADEWLIPNSQRTVKFATGENVIRGGKASPGRFESGAPGERVRRFPATRMGVEAVMRRGLAAGKEYAEAKAAYERDKAAGKDVPPMRRDVRLEALAGIVEGRIWINSHCYRADEILRLLAVAEDFGVRVANLHHCLEAYRIIPEIVRHGCGTVTFADWWAYKVEAYNAVPQNAGMLLRAGVNSTLKSDSAELMRHLPLEAAKCMKYSGLSSQEALRLVTLNVAHQFALDDRLGSIDVGKDADLVVWDGHPLDTFSKPVLTLIEGEVYFRHRDFTPSAPKPPHVAPRSFASPTYANPHDAFLASAGASSVLRPAPPADGPAYAVVGATIHPVSAPAIENGTLLIRGDRIVAVGAGADVPADAIRVDARGLHVWPGLINAATTVGLAEIDQVDVSNDTDETGLYLPDLSAASAFNPFSRMTEVTRADGTTSMLLVAQGSTVSGQAALLHLDGWSMPEMAADRRVALVLSLPSKRPEPLFERTPSRREMESFVSELQARDEGSLGQLREVETFFRAAKLYAAAKADPKTASGVRNDARYDALVPYATGQKPVLFAADSYKAILEAIQFADEHGLRPIILGGREAWKLADLLAARTIPVIFEGVFAIPGNVESVPTASEAWDAQYRAPAIMQAAGVKFCLCARESSLAKILPIHAGMAVAHGWNADDAMRAMTLSAAEILGVEEQLGSLDVGKLANVIVTSDHPAQASNMVKYVFVRGKPIPLDSDHTRQAAKFAGRPTPVLPTERTDLRGPKTQTNWMGGATNGNR